MEENYKNQLQEVILLLDEVTDRRFLTQICTMINRYLKNRGRH